MGYSGGECRPIECSLEYVLCIGPCDDAKRFSGVFVRLQFNDAVAVVETDVVGESCAGNGGDPSLKLDAV